MIADYCAEVTKYF